MQVGTSSVKNKRDDYDPIFGNARAGWHQRALGPSRMKVIHLLDDLSFDALTGFVKDLLRDPAYRESMEVKDFLDALKREHRDNRQFLPRGATGRISEELFLAWFREGKTPFRGTIEDKRDDGCGYDFRIRDDDAAQLVEVKGVGDQKGGVLFTDKEWQTALNNANYALALFVNIRETPELCVIRNPSVLLSPRRMVTLSVQVGWQVPATQLVSEDNDYE